MSDLKILPGITLATLVLSLTLSVPNQKQTKVASARAIATPTLPSTSRSPNPRPETRRKVAEVQGPHSRSAGRSLKANPQQTITQKQNRTALVIGNTEYQQATSLRNPKNDATDIANVLEELGFEVILVLDANLQQMKQALKQFESKLSSGGIALLYYAGHGIQVKGENYLIPIDAKLTREEDTRSETLPLTTILWAMEANQTKNIIIIDACRNDPFSQNWKDRNIEIRTRGGIVVKPIEGLAPIEASFGSLIAYATAPGETANDGFNRNGTYTEHLLRHIKTPNLDIEIMFRNVRAGVYQATRREQIPWVSVSLTEGIFLNPTEEQRPISTSSTSSTSSTNNFNAPVIAAALITDPNSMYQRLEQFLAAEKWRKADEQTWEIMRQIGNNGATIYLDEEEIDNLYCPDLKAIDDLWTKYSHNRFGFSIQKNLYQMHRGNSNYQNFAERVGWRRQLNQNQTEYLPYNQLTFLLDIAPLGHLPTAAGRETFDSVVRQWPLYTQEYETLMDRLYTRAADCQL